MRAVDTTREGREEGASVPVPTSSQDLGYDSFSTINTKIVKVIASNALVSFACFGGIPAVLVHVACPAPRGLFLLVTAGPNWLTHDDEGFILYVLNAVTPWSREVSRQKRKSERRMATFDVPPFLPRSSR